MKKSSVFRYSLIFASIAAIFFAAVAKPASAARLKDIASIRGVRSNQLIGYGLVVGLKNSGDQSYKSPFTIQALLSMLERLGATVDIRQQINRRTGVPDIRFLRDIRVENVAAVMVTADLPPFVRQGARIDVVVSSLGDAKSLKGGTLLLTPLKATNGEVFAVAQGALSVGGAFNEGFRRTSISKNHPTVGRLAGGGVVEREVGFDFNSLDKLVFLLNYPDFTTAQRAIMAVNTAVGADVAKAIDSGAFEVEFPEDFIERKVEFISTIERLDVQTDTQAKVVLDERTGTIIIGQNVTISRVAISHGNLTIKIGDGTEVSQPSPLTLGQTVIVPKSILSVEELGGKSGRVMVLEPGANIADLAKALNALGVKPRDLITIFQTLRAANALKAHLEII
ncbi:Flagellar P-ring protein FlgI [hydrothermal vent metagenome]|uniref:Flagellar P-ring protein FlgI n=1 Tax=hydrothermal vent metagenome TaxID=652676 RepID=A0A3B1CJC6_9ZZZZ